MKKKFTFILSFILILFWITSCSVGSKPRSVESYEKITGEKTDDELTSALSSVEDSVVSVSYCLTPFSTETYVSGVLYKHEGNKYYVITTSDVSSALSVKVYFESSKYQSASVIGYDKQNNIGILSFTSLNTYSIANLIDYTPTVGEEVFSIATYKHQGSLNERYYDILHKGVISRYDSLSLQHTALSSENEYGAPLFDYDGNLIGISTKKITSVSGERINGLNFAIYGSGLSKIISDINYVSGNVGRYNFSCSYNVYNKYVDTDKSLPEDALGAIHILSLTLNNTFYKLLKSNDTIYKINGSTFKDATDFTNILNLLRNDEPVAFMVYRNSKSITITYN